jgi:hypothetical protein
MLRVYRVVDRVFYHITKKDYDGVYLITGDEGKGKSNLGLHIINYWYKKLYNECKPEHISHINLDKMQFAEDLKNLKKYEAIDYDEAGELSNKRAMSKFNYLMSQTYQVIRGDNIFSILTLPSIFDLDAFFSRRRVKGLFNVYARGKVAFYDAKRIKQIINLNQNRILKKVTRVRPLFVDHFKKYEGVLLEPYKEKKAAKMQKIRENLYLEMQENEQFDKIDVAINNLKDKGFNHTEIGKLFNITRQAVDYRVRKLQSAKHIIV